LAACGGSSNKGGEGAFALIEFLESGQNNIPRNRQVRFRFSEAVAPGQDLFTRLRIQNVEQIQGGSNFARAQGFYLLNAEMVIFTPRLPNKPDRSDAGFREDGNYHVFLEGGPNGLRSASGDSIPTQQEFIFETNQYFEDVIPAEPPRALQLIAIDPTTGDTFDISRYDPRPDEEATTDNATLKANDKILDPGAGGPDDYEIPWRIELRISETVDPSTVNGSTVQLHEIYENAFTTAPDTVDDDHFGDPVNFRVAANVEVVQSIDAATGDYDIRIRVTPLQTLVDNTRYRLTFSGQILGIDFRKTFSGDNGLTGDGTSLVGGTVYIEDGGRGYVSEFLVRDRDPIDAARTLQYDPSLDGIEPERGQTANSEDDLNSSLYNPAQAPGTAVGFLSAFGQGADGPYAVSGGNTVQLNTGDTPNEPLGSPFTVRDLNPNDDYLGNPLPGEDVTYDSVEPFELELESLTVSSSSVLEVIGVNPVLFRVTGIVDIKGTIELSGSAGGPAGGGLGTGGGAGAGGYPGGNAKRGSASCTNTWGSNCQSFSTYLNACSQAKNSFPDSFNGEGPGRGFAGGEIYNYDYTDDRNNSATGTGGGGGGHAVVGGDGEDRRNSGGAQGSAGPACALTSGIRNSGVIGVRGKGGAAYGDRLIVDVNMGGSGGAAGGSTYAWGGNAKAQAGGGGGGAGGSIGIIAAGNIFVTGGVIDARGGSGGKGNIQFGGSSNWYSAAGGGGGGGGGTIALISGANIDLSAGTVNASGGAGGARGDNVAGGCNGCNAGGDGGKGFIFMMDADGEITGFIPFAPGQYDSDARGVLTITEFDASRFSSITAITELFPMTAAKPQYVQYDPLKDILGNVANNKQRIRVTVSSALSNPDDPTLADPGSEDNATEVALLHYDGGATKVMISGNMNELNDTPDQPDRRAFVRVRAAFEYDNGVEAALGPFASMDEVKISYNFNG
jgi:hypothetical protein